MTNRVRTHSAVSTELALLSNKHLADFLATATPLGFGIGGETASIEVGGTRVFVKKIRLTDLERLPENVLSTANLFGLPLSFQYGIQSGGFNAWRELAAHVMTTNWILSGECMNFPLMYHWRVLPSSLPNPATPDELGKINSPAIRARLEAKQKASADIVLFMEFIPNVLPKWFREQMSGDEYVEQSATTMVEHDLKAVTSFMGARGLLHFDALFENILTDGRRLYFTDFGWAISRRFELSVEENAFFKRHRDYDRALVLNSLVRWALPATLGADDRYAIVQEYAAGRGSMKFSPAVTSILNRYAPVAKLVMDFHRAPITKTETSPYPDEEIAKACAAAGMMLSQLF